MGLFYRKVGSSIEFNQILGSLLIIVEMVSEFEEVMGSISG
jgi:hypothetical protein